MKTIYKLIVKDCVRFLNDRRAFLLTFVVPLVMIIIFGNIFGGSGAPRGKTGLILVNNSNSILARLIEQKLDSSKSIQTVKTFVSDNRKDTILFTEQTAKEWVKSGKISAAVIIPKDFFADTSSAIRFKYYFDPKNEIESNIIQGNMQQTIMSQIPKVFPVLMQRKAMNEIGKENSEKFIKGFGNILNEYFNVNADSFVTSVTQLDSTSLLNNSTVGGSQSNFANNLVVFESEQLVGKEVSNPGLTRVVGGWAMMFLLFSLTGAATSFFEEKQEGTLKRLLCMPITSSQILISKYIYSIALGTVQLLFLFILSWILFDVDVFSNFGNLMIVIVSSAATAVAFGMLITSVSKTIAQASGLSTLFILMMSALGGAWFPVSFLPDWMQIISKSTLTYWSVEAFLQVLWRQSNFITILPNILVLIITAVLINSYALVRFKRNML